VLLVTRGHFQSRDKDGGHTIRPAISQNSCYTQTSWLYGWSKFYISGIGIFDLFCSCYLDLDPMTLIYELDPYSLEVHRMCKYQYVKAFESYRLTDRQTNRW